MSYETFTYWRGIYKNELSDCYNPKPPLTSIENSTFNELTHPTHHFENNLHNLDLGKWIDILEIFHLPTALHSLLICGWYTNRSYKAAHS